MFIFRDLLVKIILRVGKFELVDVRLTAACLGMFCLGIFAQGLVILIAKGFYSLQDTKSISTSDLESSDTSYYNVINLYDSYNIEVYGNRFNDIDGNLIDVDETIDVKLNYWIFILTGLFGCFIGILLTIFIFNQLHDLPTAFLFS